MNWIHGLDRPVEEVNQILHVMGEGAYGLREA